MITLLDKSKNFLTLIPIHPFLFAVFPILFFYSNNIKEVFLEVLPLPIFISLGLTTLILILLTFLLKKPTKAATLTTFLLIISFSYGHVKNTVGGPENVVLFSWVVISIVGFILLVRTGKKLSGLTTFLNLASILLVGFSFINIIYFEISNDRTSRLFKRGEENNTLNSIKLDKPENPPDIYYLIFDRYASIKTLQGTYNYDTSKFTKYLTQKGFYVATNSRANYPRSFLSLGSSLNMRYVNYLPDQIGAESGDEAAAYYLLEGYEVQKVLRSIGYKYIHIGGWWEPTRKNENADKNYFYSQFKFKYLQGLNEFSTKLIETTIVSAFLYKTSEKGASEPLWGRTNHREGILFQFEKLNEVIETGEGPKFVFAHFLTPHPPYVLDQECNPTDEKTAKSRSDQENYLGQLTCANNKIEETVEKILQKSNGRSIIILQADEGPEPIKSRLNKQWQTSPLEAIEEKIGILNAYYLPDKDKKILHPSITPVNSFRIIFNLYFDTDFDILEGKIYVTENEERPYKFFDFTEKLK